MAQFIVSYSLPYRHHVSVAIEAEDEASAIATATAEMDAGTLWADRPEMPLVVDDFEEEGDSGEVLEFTAVQVVKPSDLEPDASVLALRRQANALDACAALVAAYEEGAAAGGRVNWEAVDDAYALASQVIAEG